MLLAEASAVKQRFLGLSEAAQDEIKELTLVPEVLQKQFKAEEIADSTVQDTTKADKASKAEKVQKAKEMAEVKAADQKSQSAVNELKLQNDLNKKQAAATENEVN